MSLMTTVAAVPASARRFWTILSGLRRARPKRPAVLALKLDERLLADVGLTEQDVLGVERSYWREWARSQRAWNL